MDVGEYLKRYDGLLKSNLSAVRFTILPFTGPAFVTLRDSAEMQQKREVDFKLPTSDSYYPNKFDWDWAVYGNDTPPNCKIPVDGYSGGSVSYTHLTLPTNREV